MHYKSHIWAWEQIDAVDQSRLFSKKKQISKTMCLYKSLNNFGIIIIIIPFVRRCYFVHVLLLLTVFVSLLFPSISLLSVCMAVGLVFVFFFRLSSLTLVLFYCIFNRKSVPSSSHVVMRVRWFAYIPIRKGNY